MDETKTGALVANYKRRKEQLQRCMFSGGLSTTEDLSVECDRCEDEGSLLVTPVILIIGRKKLYRVFK